MPRTYEQCNSCGARLVMVGDSPEQFGEPPLATRRYYICPGCDRHWTLDRARNAWASGFPDEVLRDAVDRGLLTKEGRLDR
ncbi:MAG: hypothetical protein AUI36_03545 [Cyanobacteria bacterium 13_1_40CM_2_61_4]|nr:MAG: hypothetical protein AUI36_03545 [Cyanobacteria bacterium 13_1_40CM_2_61_4]